ncbi:XRE family transcriptional regulator [Streptococcus dysgalactiae subsp. dysgalactiae]|nr:helix-turn-helix transcriptional regulator [Streptococcus dysgalactiae]QGG98500.1 XRE family transcriptional regulator [Streptococcus dysgalactiae subsp. dysgalactiae]
MKNIVGENINRILYSRNISQEQLANLSGLSRQTINSLVSNTKQIDPKLSTIFKLSTALDIELIQFFERRENFDHRKNKNVTFEDYYNTLIQNVKSYTHLFTQKSLSSNPGLSESYISHLLNFKINDIHISTLEKLSKQIDIEITELLKRG